MQDRHGDLNYKMVVAPCKTGIVAISTQDGVSGGPLQDRHCMTDLHYKMVVVVVPCKTDIVIDDTDMVLLSTRNWWLWWPPAGQTL